MTTDYSAVGDLIDRYVAERDGGGTGHDLAWVIALAIALPVEDVAEDLDAQWQAGALR